MAVVFFFLVSVCAAGVPSLANHRASVLSIAVLSTEDPPSSASCGKVWSHGLADLEEGEENIQGLSFQLATLDQ